ncbi:hypothetical protein AX15_004410 [Amanita polypyramis BW_CC]|nr:hypothetical protein AX15_004410 [Amanita polypyramis BW_CC]
MSNPDSLRLSLDSDLATTPPALNGRDDDTEDLDPVARLQRELDRAREEKESLATQYRNLLAKLTTMRTTLGNKLKQDAEELDRQEQLVQQLSAEKDDLSATVETLRQELIASNDESERVSQELDSLRSRALQENAQETLARERELRETESELERCRLDRDEWERVALEERAIADDAKASADVFRRHLDLEVSARERVDAELQAEQEKSANLQSVLQDFQSAKDHELRQAVEDYRLQLNQTVDQLAEYKHRALTAEAELSETHASTSKARDLEKEVKEKNLLIGKLRHEAVILNEHLMEALRRLRRNSSGTNVDRQLVSNVFLSFLSTPRADTKRYEMLSLLASILSWSDQEREKAGLQRAHPANSNSSFWNRSSSSSASSPAGTADLEKTDETESFSRLWVEFLLTEAAAGESPSTTASPAKADVSLPGSPTLSSISMSKSNSSAPRRLVPFSITAGMASSPTLSLSGLPSSRKGKEKEVS